MTWKGPSREGLSLIDCHCLPSSILFSSMSTRFHSLPLYLLVSLCPCFCLSETYPGIGSARSTTQQSAHSTACCWACECSSGQHVSKYFRCWFWDNCAMALSIILEKHWKRKNGWIFGNLDWWRLRYQYQWLYFQESCILQEENSLKDINFIKFGPLRLMQRLNVKINPCF